MKSNNNDEINDDEIRIISSEDNRQPCGKKGRLTVWICAIGAFLMAVVLAVILISKEEPEEEDATGFLRSVSTAGDAAVADDSVRTASPYVERTDTVLNGADLIILTPIDAEPSLEVGNDVLNDSAAVLIVQAADIRGDNGGIVGSFVIRGELVGKGEAKAGFCSIINGELTVGVADATPMFEQALISGGYFFRQYPLVVGGQIVENKPKGRSIRRALVDVDGRISVVISRNSLSFHDFSKALTDLGVRNAIYLVGGKAYGRCLDSDGKMLTFGSPWDKEVENVNYIVWR